MSKNRILTIEQIKESENQFICKNSEEQLLNIAGEKIAIFLLNKFKIDQNNKSSKFYRYINEIPTLLLILIIFIVIFKPI